MIYIQDESGNTKVNPKKIIEQYRKGKEVIVETEEGYDVTKEFLIKQALGSALIKPRECREFIMLDLLKIILDEDVLDDILDAGGVDSWLSRKRRL